MHNGIVLVISDRGITPATHGVRLSSSVEDAIAKAKRPGTRG